MIGFNKVNLFCQFKVCANVDEIFCDVEPYTDCNMPQNDVFYNDTEDSIKTWPIIKCYDEQGFHHHTKDHPVCKNETKLDCIYTWHVDSEGNKVMLNVNMFGQTLGIINYLINENSYYYFS